MKTKLESVSDVIYDEMGVLAGQMGRTLSERTAKKVLESLSEYWGEVADGKREPEDKVVPDEITMDVEPVESKKETSSPHQEDCVTCQAQGYGATFHSYNPPVKNRGTIGIDPSKFHGIVSTTDPRIQERNDYILKRRQAGVTWIQIAREVGVSDQRMYQLKKKLLAQQEEVKPTPTRTSKFGPPRTIDRDEVKRRREAGQSLSEIAKAMNVTRQGVALVSRELGIDAKDVIRNRDALNQERRDKLVKKMKAYLNQNPDADRETILSEVGVSDADRAAVLRQLNHTWPRKERSTPYQNRFTDEEMFKSLRRVRRKVGGKFLSAALYEANRKNGVDPSVPAFNIRFGTWANACNLAKVKHGTPNRIYTSRWDKDTVETAISNFIEHCKKEKVYPSYNSYERWQRGKDDAPSGATVRKVMHEEHWPDIVKRLKK